MNKSFALPVILSLHLSAYSQQDSMHSSMLKDSVSEKEKTKSDQVYKLNPIVDIPIVVVGGVFSGLAFTQIYSKDPSTEQEILDLKISDVPKFDRWAAGMSSQKADDNSDYFFYGTIPLPFLLLADKDIRHDAPKIGYMYLEAMAITGMIYTGSVYFVDRYRPLTYDTSIPVNERTTGNNKNAFLAGHPALVATGTFFAAKVYADYHPESNLKYVFYGVAAVATGTTAYLRHIAGKHFPSDLLAGVTVGTLSGILVPQFHKNKSVKEHNLGFAPFIDGNAHGLTMRYTIK